MDQTKKHTQLDEMFAANLAFQQRDLALIVSFRGEFITERPPLK